MGCASNKGPGIDAMKPKVPRREMPEVRREDEDHLQAVELYSIKSIYLDNAFFNTIISSEFKF